MKTILAAALILALGITGISLWEAVHARRMAVSSSQIFIHGTPVCVMEQSGRIHAMVGMCSAVGGDFRGEGPGNGGGFPGGPPSSVEPGPGLPPGHPPIGIPPASGPNREILI